MRPYIFTIAVWLLIVWVICGCTSPDEKAQKLLDEGKYSELIREFAGTKWADIAERAQQMENDEKVAKYMFDQHDYQVLVWKFPTSRYAPMARDSAASELFQRGQYQIIIEEYPQSEAAKRIDKEFPYVRRGLELQKANEKKREEIAEKRQKREATKRKANCRYHPSDCLEIGMSRVEVRLLLGNPDENNRTVTSALGEEVVSEQWVYEDKRSDSFRAAYVYFEDGVLTGWQE